jgi:hypothetical protein
MGKCTVDRLDIALIEITVILYYLECLTTIERQDLTQHLLSRIANEIEQVLQPENRA